MTLIVGGTYLLAGVPDAIRHLEAGQARGKFAIGVGVALLVVGVRYEGRHRICLTPRQVR